MVKISQLLINEKLYSKKFDAKFAEKIIKRNFSLCWGWFYGMQIPVIIGYQKFFQDLTTYHIWGTITINQALTTRFPKKKYQKIIITYKQLLSQSIKKFPWIKCNVNFRYDKIQELQ